MVNLPPFLPPSVGLARLSAALPANSFSVTLAAPPSVCAGVPPWSPASSSSPPQAPMPRTATSAASASKVFQRDLVMVGPFLCLSFFWELERAWASLAPGVERVLQPVADEVEGEHGEEQREAGEEHEPPGVGEQLAGLGDHRAPRRRAAGDADAEERERRLEQDVGRDQQRRVDDQRREEVGENLPRDDPRVRRAQRACGLDELLLTQGQDLTAHDARDVRPVD